ncbi:hydrogenase nickel incorporation protein HypB [Hippea maritima]|uniref:Hydrogenase accessory protein HypB n=1 Tax=Hippea maritima (strain ATCC 700847 / DSM 10411 / MH2) TaxID=760142 RepID=F2LWC5_HIPMA|nr:hydrogenase nickel incorporation protein HypB [Hippea maritima]AEA34059.1 hydrogenase accessory protein HypB [Hippea maritima DSM 10411]
MKRVVVQKKVLERNDETANKIRELLASKGIFSLNFMSSPGAGKTTIVEKTIQALKDDFRISFIDGDLDTDRDAERVKALGVDVVQINTSGACHLDAQMVYEALGKVSLNCDLLIIENVGNLVCPATFDIGVDKNIVILSVPEGDDKVKKYPVMFNVADVVLINKIDLLDILDFDLEKVKGELREISPNAKVFEVSAKNDTNLDSWFNYLKELVKPYK